MTSRVYCPLSTGPHFQIPDPVCFQFSLSLSDPTSTISLAPAGNMCAQTEKLGRRERHSEHLASFLPLLSPCDLRPHLPRPPSPTCSSPREQKGLPGAMVKRNVPGQQRPPGFQTRGPLQCTFLLTVSIQTELREPPEKRKTGLGLNANFFSPAP